MESHLCYIQLNAIFIRREYEIDAIEIRNNAIMTNDNALKQREIRRIKNLNPKGYNNMFNHKYFVLFVLFFLLFYRCNFKNFISL